MICCDVNIVSKRYNGTPVLQDVTFDVAMSSFTALVGPSGAGKTTLLNILGGLDRDFEGRLAWAGGGPGKVAYLFQEPRLMPWLTVRRNIELVLPNPVAVAARVDALLEVVGLARWAGAYPRALSGGMQRRAALARALAIAPDLLLLDEPFASLDEPTAESLRDLLLQLWREQSMAVLLVTHNLREALAMAESVLFLSRDPARIVLREQLSAPATAAPAQRDTQALMQNLLARHPGILSGVRQGQDP